MNNSPDEDSKNTPTSSKELLKKAQQTLETTNETAKNAGSLLNTIKWLAIAFITLILFLILFKVYQIVAAPAKAVGDAVGGVSDAVKSGTEAVTDGTASVINRLDIPTTNQRQLDKFSELAFDSISNMAVSEPEGVRERMFWASNLGGHEGRVCAMTLDFGNGDIPVFAAADNEAHATARALGSKDDRLMRVLIETGEDDVAINAYWNEDSAQWQLKWKSTTLKKSASDDVAQARMMDVLKAIPKLCPAEPTR